VNLAFEATGAAVYGVDRKIFTRRLSGAGKALGVRFRPGGFRPFNSRPIFSLNDRVVPASRLFGPAADEACAVVMAADADDAAMIAAATGLLRGFGAAVDPVVEQAAGLAKRITEDPGLQRVAQLAEVSGLSERRLQRLFADYVGVSPKWVMRRARLHEAALRVEADGPVSVDWAVLAADLGYADQAHLARDFTATLGVPPSRYAAGPESQNRAELLIRGFEVQVPGGAPALKQTNFRILKQTNFRAHPARLPCVSRFPWTQRFIL
jgi:AraC-like DNA-binding protein